MAEVMSAQIEPALSDGGEGAFCLKENSR